MLDTSSGNTGPGRPRLCRSDAGQVLELAPLLKRLDMEIPGTPAG